VTDTTPLPEGILAGVALAIVDAFAKFKEHAQRGFIQKSSDDPDCAPFGEKFFTVRVGRAIVDPSTCQI